MSFDERFLGGPPVPDRGREWRALAELRWCGGKLQQAWAPHYGGTVEWRDVPTVPDTSGVMASERPDPEEQIARLMELVKTIPPRSDPKARQKHLHLIEGQAHHIALGVPGTFNDQGENHG